MDHMEFSIALPSYVEFTNAGMEWENMKQRLHAHINHSSDVNHQQIQGLVKAFLINIAAEQVQEVFNMFGLSYEEAVKFNRILQRLEDVCLPRFLIIYNRYKFFTCKQTCNGKFNDFLKNLVKWSENCEFGDLKDILMKDCIITGISDNAVRQCLMETEELSFFKSLEICRGVEQSQKMKNISVSTEDTERMDTGSNTESQHVDIPCFKSYNDISTNTTVDFISDVETDNQNNSELNLYQELQENKPQNQAIKIELKSNISTLASNENNLEKKMLPKPRRSKRSKTRKSTKTFFCDNCDKSFPDQLSVKLHLCCSRDEQQKQTVNVSCRVCKLVVTDRSALIKHRLVHKGEKRFKCETCSANFSNASHLKVHMRLHTGERPYTCDTCGASFPESSKLKSHLRKHTGERPFTCEVCQRKFSWTAAYTRHLRTHTGEKPYTCEFCGGNFADFTSLQRHRRTHTKEKPYSCDTCQAKFTDPSALKLHKRGHTGERPYTCQKCKSSFVRSQHLKEHMKLHTGEKPHECKTCGAKFVEASKLKSHIRRHTGEKPYLCKICGTSFAWTAAYTRHMRTHTLDKPYFCDYCGSRFADHSTLTRHTRTHTGERPYVCKDCGSNFADNSSLNRHMRIHTGEKSYVCEVCGSSFAVKSYLVRHMRTHTGEKPYHCETCGSKFTDSSKLSRHKKIHSKSAVKQTVVENQECDEQQEEQFAQLQPLHLVPQDSDPLQLHHHHLLDSQPAEPTPEEHHPMTLNEDLQHPLLLSTNLIPLTHMLPFNASIIS